MLDLYMALLLSVILCVEVANFMALQRVRQKLHTVRDKCSGEAEIALSEEFEDELEGIEI